MKAHRSEEISLNINGHVFGTKTRSAVQGPRVLRCVRTLYAVIPACLVRALCVS